MYRNQKMSRDFRVCMSQLCLMSGESATPGPYADQPLLDWLTGVNKLIGGVKPFAIRTSINRTTARYFIESALYWVRYVGHTGTVILLDNSRVTLTRRPKPPDGKRYYTRAMTMEHYELLREFIDGVDRLAGALLVVVTNQDFLDDSADRGSRGYGIYQALRTRIMDDVRGPEFGQPGRVTRAAVTRRRGSAMVAHVEENNALAYRLALEALRSGVPNREAVRIMGCNQPRAETRFNEMLTRAADADNPPSQSQGMLVSGDFGTGKSHLLAHLEHQALSQNFICSKVVISKETPLYDLGKVFTSAMENGRMPDRSGRLIEELAHTMNPDSREYAAFFRWANDAASSGLLSPMFPASLAVYEGSGDLELNGEIESFWAGDRILISKVKNGLKLIGQQRNYSFRAPKAADLPPQRLSFAIELIKAGGIQGWVLLI